MLRIFFWAFLSTVVLPTSLRAHVFPREGSKLNYRLIGFSLPFENKKGEYKIEIATGHFNDLDSFEKNITITTNGQKNKIIGEVPSFGSQYTWRATYMRGNSPVKTSGLYHFSTGFLPVVDSAKFRERIIQHSEKHRDAAIFIDALGVLYDMDGRPLWYMPGVKYESNTTVQPRDIKLSPMGTITYLINSSVYEINYNGDTLWSKTSDKGAGKYPDNAAFHFHHQFSRLNNGHYMALGTENVLCKLPSGKDTGFTIIPADSIADDTSSAYKSYSKKSTGDLIEYDERGNIAWIWRSWQYVLNSNLKYYSLNLRGFLDMHDNAFYFDERDKTIYVSFKNVDGIVKVKYPEGNVLNYYGNKYSKHGVEKNVFFHCQHAINRADNGDLYLFDNGCDTITDPKLLLLREPADDKDSLGVLWEYTCPVIDTLNKTGMGPNPGGGNIEELPDRSFFVAMGLRNSVTFIVNADKEVVWSAITEHWDIHQKKWTRVLSYKASMINNRKDLEQLIWNSEK